MNIGDKYTCIKDIPGYFLKNKTYSIIEINKESFILRGEKNNEMCFYINTPDANTYVSYEHFTNIKQIRKQKIEKIKINESRG